MTAQANQKELRRRRRRYPAMIEVKALERRFTYNGTRLPDPNPAFTAEEVRDMYVSTYPELATASVEGPSPNDGAMEYTFTRAVGAKG
jgi:PRTRC genetic system protein C